MQYPSWCLRGTACALASLLPLLASGSSSRIAADHDPYTCLTESRSTLTFYLPQCYDSEPSRDRLLGSRAAWQHCGTLWCTEQRVELYKAVFQDLVAPDPHGSRSREELSGRVQDALAATGNALDEDARQLMQETLLQVARNVDARYATRGTLPHDLHNTAARIARNLRSGKLNLATHPGLASACLALEGLQSSLLLSDVVAGAVLLQGLYTDQAAERAARLRVEVLAWPSADRAAQLEALKRLDLDILAVREVGALAAFAVSVNEHLSEITSGSASLAAVLVKVPHAWAFVGVWKTLEAILDMDRLIQEATLAATLAMHLDAASSEDGVRFRQRSEELFYRCLIAAFDGGLAHWRDWLSPGHNFQDWREHFQTQLDRLLLSRQPALPSCAEFEQQLRSGQLQVFRENGEFWEYHSGIDENNTLMGSETEDNAYGELVRVECVDNYCGIPRLYIETYIIHTGGTMEWFDSGIWKNFKTGYMPLIGGENIQLLDGVLYTNQPEWGEDDAHCCPSYTIREKITLINGKLGTCCKAKLRR